LSNPRQLGQTLPLRQVHPFVFMPEWSAVQRYQRGEEMEKKR
jgi:hypothetical protein